MSWLNAAGGRFGFDIRSFGVAYQRLLNMGKTSSDPNILRDVDHVMFFF